MLNELSIDTELNSEVEETITKLMNEKHDLEAELQRYRNTSAELEKTESRLADIMNVVEAMANHPLIYDDKLIRQIVDCVEVKSDRIQINFVGGKNYVKQICK